MIPYINAQLVRWSDWLRTGHTRLGYPRRAAFVGAMGGGRGAAIHLPDDEAMAICTAVAALEPSLHAAVECYYRSMQNCTADQIAKHLSCSRRTVFDRIDRAHIHLIGYLNDLAAGVSVPAWSAPKIKKSA
jgi:DNA-directed RNA polymerase specialized sigma24 family protein